MSGTSSAFAVGACSSIEIAAGLCGTSANVGNGGVDLGVGVTTPGVTPDSGRGGATGPVSDEIPCAQRLVCRDTFGATLPLEGRGPITLADLVNFRPVVGALRTEPAGWAVVGLPTNLYVGASRHVEDDLLLGQPASVRFTPVSFTWTYGDGLSGTTSTPGASWAALGAQEFDATATSHVYAEAGVFRPTVVTSFRAEYRFGAAAGWTAIDGTVPITTSAETVTAGSAKTVLVDQDCRRNPQGPGC